MGRLGFAGALLASLLAGCGWFGFVVPWVFNNLTAATLYGLGAVVGWAIVFVVSIILSVFVVIGLAVLCVLGAVV